MHRDLRCTVSLSSALITNADNPTLKGVNTAGCKLSKERTTELAKSKRQLILYRKNRYARGTVGVNQPPECAS